MIDKVGAVVGGLTYGVRREAVVDHFEVARTLHAQSAVVLAEHAHASLLVLDGARTGRTHALCAEAPPASRWMRWSACTWSGRWARSRPAPTTPKGAPSVQTRRPVKSAGLSPGADQAGLSRSQSRSFSVSRLSNCFLPLARPTLILMRPLV